MSNINLGRVQVTRGTPVCAPGKCIVCGNCGGPEDMFVDFGFDIDFYGTVYFCSNCIIEVANAIGFLPVDRFLKLEEHLHEQSNRLEILKFENRELQHALDSLVRAGYTVGNVSGNQLSMDEVEPEPAEPDSARETRPTKQTDESRFTGLSDNESLNTIFNL